MFKIKLILVLIVLALTSCNQKNKRIMPPKIEAPICAKQDTILEKHGDKRVDPYYWLKNRENPEVIQYLENENKYYDKMIAHTLSFQKNLFEEMKSRIKEDDESVPYFHNGYHYITRYETGKQYPIYSRKKGSLNSQEEILFNCNEMAKDKDFFDFSEMSISPDNELAAFAIDFVGRRFYTIQIKDLVTGEILADKIVNTTGNYAWANDNKTLFYSIQDPQTLRSNRIYKHIVGADSKSDGIVFEEKDEMYSCYVYKEKSEKYLTITTNSTLTSEFRILDANTPNDKFRIFHPRTKGLEYSIAHYDDHFYVLTNKDKATNFKLMKTPEMKTSSDNWVDLVPHRENTLIEGMEIFKNFLVLEERNDGLTKIKIMPRNGEAYYLPFNSETYTAYLSINPDFNTDVLRYTYTSLKTPRSTIDFNMKDKSKKILKEAPVLGGKFNKDNYEEKRLWATADDGVKIPISIIYKKGLELNGESPLLQYAYGSYGSSTTAGFSSLRLSLLDRGFIYAIAHVRGGQEMGRQWYDNGKFLKKKNTFTDFIACSKLLIKEKYTSPKHLYAEGGSAGGLLMGAIVNIAPELYNGVIVSVPFVDVVTTMLDESIPLTTSEYEEWGNPNDKVYYDYMKSYSPYDNVKAQNYPNIYVSTGLHDSQVQYWEPAKWVAKLREHKTDSNNIFLVTNMKAGHGGASGRFEALKEVAKEYGFILDLEGIYK
jgi:oligopeptidase B